MTKRPILIHAGIVTQGEGRGKTLGFPTANLPYKELDLSGTYAARAIIGGGIYRAAVYANPARNLLEAHILGLDMDLYGLRMVLELLEKVSANEAFTDESALKEHIATSVAKVEQYFKF